MHRWKPHNAGKQRGSDRPEWTDLDEYIGPSTETSEKPGLRGGATLALQ